MKRKTNKLPIQRENASEGFLSGVLVLSASTVIVKIIGLAYKIPMLDRLGAVGMGYFNSAYEIYALLCMIATAGFPVALSMMIAKANENRQFEAIEKIDRISMFLFIGIGIWGSIGLIAFAKPLAFAVGNTDAYFCILAIAPALLAACYSGAVRGYFQGFHNMVPTAVSQLLESFGKLIFGVGFASWALNRHFDLPIVSAYAMLGVTVGLVISSVYLFIIKHWQRSKRSAVIQKSKSKGILRNLLYISVPITLGALLLSGTKLMDATLMMHRLQSIGYSTYEATEMYGAYTTLAVPIFGLIPSLITPISLVLIPKLTAVLERSERENEAMLTEESIRLTVLFSMPASFGIVLFSNPILQMLFGNQEEAVEMVAPLLSVLGGAILFSGMITTTNAILQAYRHTVLPIVSMIIGVLVKGISAYLLIGLPSVGAAGAPLSTFLCNVSITVLNLYFLRRCIPKTDCSRGMLGLYVKPLVASSVSMLMALLVYWLLERNSVILILSLSIAIFSGAIFYFLLAFLMGVVTMKDLMLLPFGKRMLNHANAKIDKLKELNK